LDNPLATAELLEETRDAARARLRAQGEDIVAADALWKRLGDHYLLRHPAEDIAWHTPALLQHLQGPHADRFLILVRGVNARGATEVFLCGPDRSGLFSLTTHAFDRLHLDIVDARVITTPEKLFLSSYMLLDERGEPIEDPWRLDELQKTLESSVRDAEPLPLQTRRHTRHQKHFRHPVRCVTHTLAEQGISTLELYTSDRPGLLSAIADVFSEQQVDLRDARITTFGERVEDLFFISQRGTALDEMQSATVCSNIQQRVEAL
jgi:[protein-PII] uridylyltransferase